MELEKIRSLSDEELSHQGKADAEQLFRLRFQVSLGQNDGVKKLRQLRKEIAQIKTIERERALGIRGAKHDDRPAAEKPEKKPKTVKAAKAAKKAKAPRAAKAVKAKKTVKATKTVKKSAKKSAKKGAAKA